MALPGETACRAIVECGSLPDLPPSVVYARAGAPAPGDGSHDNPYPTIFAAISNGATAVALEGKFTETLTINKSLTLIGKCPEQTQLTGTIVINAGDVVVDRMAITGGSHDLDISGGSLKISRSRITGATAGAVRVHAPTVVTDSLFDGNIYYAFLVSSSSLSIEKSVIRGTTFRSSDGKGGAAVAAQRETAATPAVVHIADSVIIGNSASALSLQGTDLTLEATYIADTGAENSGKLGNAIQLDPWMSSPSTGDIRTSVLAHNHWASIALTDGGKLTISRTTIRDTRGLVADKKEGEGIAAQNAQLDISDSFLADNHTSGIAFQSSHGSIERTIVRRSLGRESDGKYGFGIRVLPNADGLKQSDVVIRQSLVLDAAEGGIAVATSKLRLEGCRIESVTDSNGLGGDGVSAQLGAELTIVDTLVRGTKRAGLAVFGPSGSMSGSNFECTPTPVNADAAASVTDGLDNFCGCGAQWDACSVTVATLDPGWP